MIRISSTTSAGIITKNVAAQIAQGKETDGNWRAVVNQLMKPQWRAAEPNEDGIAILEINEPEHPSIRVAAAIVKQKTGYYLADTHKSHYYQATLIIGLYRYDGPLTKLTINIREWLIQHGMLPNRRETMFHRKAEDAMGDATDLLLDSVRVAAQQERKLIAKRAIKQIKRKQKKAAERLEAEQEAQQQVGEAMPSINHLLETGQDTAPLQRKGNLRRVTPNQACTVHWSINELRSRKHREQNRRAKNAHRCRTAIGKTTTVRDTGRLCPRSDGGPQARRQHGRRPMGRSSSPTQRKN